MSLKKVITAEIKKSLQKIGIDRDFELTVPPNPSMGDFCLSTFSLAKAVKKNPVELANEILKQVQDDSASIQDDSASIQDDKTTGSRRRSAPRDDKMERQNDSKTNSLIEKVSTAGPYVNFFINTKQLVEIVLSDKDKCTTSKPQKIMVEFACPNTHKAFHIGHLRNIITGESIVRILENVGHQVVRANYQGDVGMHIAKCLYAILQLDDFSAKANKLKTVSDKAKFLGEIYAKGSTAFEGDNKAKKEIIELSKKIYNQDESIKEIYQTTRQWSLDYFDYIYKKVDSYFDRFYFESEVFNDGIKIVKEFLDKKVFEVGEKGAIIFPGEKHGLHNRVFINSEGYPTYEAKDMALAKLQFSEHNPDKIIHVVGKEQIEYFKVISKALEEVLPASRGREEHLDYGWVALKDGKMSSREGKVVLGEWLIDQVNKKVTELMKDNQLDDKEDIIKKVGMSAIKYSFLKTGVKNDIKFNLDESVSLSGDSGPYLLYIVARIKSILNKNKISWWQKILNQVQDDRMDILDNSIKIESEEKQLLLKLSSFEQVTTQSADQLDPSKIAHYLFELAQSFNSFYDCCPVLKAEKKQKEFRLRLIEKVAKTMQQGLQLLGIETVEKM